MAPDRYLSGAQSSGDVVPDVVPALAPFVSEASLPPPRHKVEPLEHPLSEFPEEAARDASRSAVKRPAARRVSPYWSFAAAIFVAAIAGAWWGSMRTDRPVATGTIAQAVVTPPVFTPPVDVPSQPPAELTSSLTLQPAARKPVANVVSGVGRQEIDRITSPPRPVARSAAVVEPRRTQERAISTRGTSGGASVPPPSRPASRPLPEPIPQAPVVAAASPVVRTPAPATAPIPETSRAPEPSVAAPPPASRTTPEMRPAPEALPSVVVRTEQNEIQRALGQYRSAYQHLDAEAAQAVWPSVDVRALSRAFDSLTSQELAFDTCMFEIAGEAATAQCRGSATYTPKVGGRAARLEPRQWTFHLRKQDEGWKIQSVQARR